MTIEEYRQRFIVRIMQRGGVPRKDAEAEYAGDVPMREELWGAGTLPEDDADECMTYWDDDGV